MNDNLFNMSDEQLSYLFNDENADLRVIRACGDRGASFGIKCLTNATENGHMDIVRYLVEEKKVLEFTRYEMDRHRSYSDNGTEPLIEAAQHGHADIVGYLLEKYPYLKDIRDDDNALPLHHAVEYASFGRRRYRRRSPSNANAKSYEECLRLLSDDWNIVYVNAESDDGTPLCFAAHHGTISAIRLLLENKADVNGGRYTSDGTPILQGNDEEETILALMDNQYVDWMATNEKGETLFHNFRPETAKLVDFYLKKLKALDNETAQLRTCEGTTLLHALVNAIGNEDLDMDSRKKLRKFIPKLIAKGIDVNAISWDDDWRYNSSGTAAHCAARNNDLETLKVLSDNGADLTVVDCNGNNLFIAAADTSRSRYRFSVADMKAVFDYLMKMKVDISQANDQGKNVLFYLCEPEKRDVFDYVLKHAKKTKAAKKMLTQTDNGRNLLSDNGRKNLLWYAVEARNLPLLNFLVDKKLLVEKEAVQDFICVILQYGTREKDTANWQQFIRENYKNGLDLPQFTSSTVLEWAISNFNDDPYDIDGIKMLIDELKIDPTKGNQESGEGIFHWLAKAYAFSSELAEYLFEKAPDLLEKPNTDGQFPIHIAARKGNLDFCKWFVSKKQDYDVLQSMDDGNTILCIYLTNSRRRNSVSSLCNDLKWFYGEAHRHDKRFFDDEKKLYNGCTPLEKYFEEAEDEAAPQVVSLLCQWCVEENKSLDNAISDWSVAGKASPACIQAYLEACNKPGLEQQIDWTKLFDRALEAGNSQLAIFIANIDKTILQESTVYDIASKCFRADDGNLEFFIMLFDKLCWPRQLINQNEGTTPSILTMLLKPESYSDDKLPLLRYFWNKFPEKPISYNELLNLLDANHNDNIIQTIEWMEGLLQEKGYSLPETSELTYRLFAQSQNISLLDNWLQKRKLENKTIPEIKLHYKDREETLLQTTCCNSNGNCIARLLMDKYQCIPDYDCIDNAEGNFQLLYNLLMCNKLQMDDVNSWAPKMIEDYSIQKPPVILSRPGMIRRVSRQKNASLMFLLMEFFHAIPSQQLLGKLDKNSELYSFAMRFIEKTE